MNENKTINGIETTVAHVTHGTKHWITSLYELGAVSYKENEGTILHPQLRSVVSAIHAVLAGGEVAINITRPGNESTYNQLERDFEAAWKETSDANKVALDANNDLDPYVP